MNAVTPILSFLLALASPASDEAGRLVDEGRDSEAFALAERGASEGDADAVNFLAWMYDEGRHVRQDQPRAARLYRQAAEAGNSHAQWRLGVMLDQAEGVPEDPDEALRWIRLAADQGLAAAYASLGVMYANGRGTKADFAQSRRHYLEAARRGEPRGFYGVGALHSNGQGVPADEVEGLAWILTAAALGDTLAQEQADLSGLEEDAARLTVDRANAILREFGHELTIPYPEPNLERDPVRVT